MAKKATSVEIYWHSMYFYVIVIDVIVLIVLQCISMSCLFSKISGPGNSVSWWRCSPGKSLRRRTFCWQGTWKSYSHGFKGCSECVECSYPGWKLKTIAMCLCVVMSGACRSYMCFMLFLYLHKTSHKSILLVAAYSQKHRSLWL